MSIFSRKIAFLVIISSIIWANYTVFAEQQLPKNQVWSITDWSGGLNTKTSPFALQKNQGIDVRNIRQKTELGSLTKRDEIRSYGTMDASEASTSLHRLYLKDATKILIGTHGNEVETGNDNTGAFTNILDLASDGYRFDWLTWHDIAIGMDGKSSPVKYDGTSASATYLGTALAADKGSGAGPSGTYSYKVSFYSTSYEVILDVASNPVTVVDNDITLTMIPIGPDTILGENIIGRKVYRNTVAAQTTWKLVPNTGTIANNTAVTIDDTEDDTAIGESTPYPAGDATWTPPKGALSVLHKNRLWVAADPDNPSRLYYSEDGSHEVFIIGNYFNIRTNDGDKITLLENWLGILTVGKNNTMQLMDTIGADPSFDWGIEDSLTSVGCQAPYSVAISPTLGIIYLSRDGLYSFNGQYSILISDVVTPEILDISKTDIENSWGIYHNFVYYLAYASQSTGSSTNDRVLVLDILSNAFDIDELSINCYTTFNSGTDWGILYSGSSSDGTVYAHESGINEVLHRRHADFTGAFTNSRYQPTRWGGDSKSPVIEISRTATINELVGTINAQTGDINRNTTTGSYISQGLQVGALSYDKLYWNETIPGAGGDVTFNIRSASTEAGLVGAWSGNYTSPSGSDISALTANTWVQYRINLTTTDIDYTPTVYKSDNYVVRINYNTEGSSGETSVDFLFESGWIDFGFPGHRKTLKKIWIEYASESTGTLNLTFTNYLYGDTDSFAIDLADNPAQYEEYFTGAAFTGRFIKYKFDESSLNALRIKRLAILYDVEPYKI